MKKIFMFIAALTLGLTTVDADNNVSYLPSLDISNKTLTKNGREITLAMDIDMGELRMGVQHTMALTPVLVSKDGKKEIEFPPVIIDGRIRDKVYQRALILESVDLPPYHNDDAQIIIRRHNSEEQTYAYEAVKPYERWMLDGRVELREKVHGCVNCAKGESVAPLLPLVLQTFYPEYVTGRIEPEPEPVKVREESRTARIDFKWDRYEILRDFRNNRAELDTVTNSILLVKNNPDVKITGIYIDGYASPEGTIAHNENLSKNRAHSLSQYIKKNVKVDDSLLHVSWHGEDWDGFRKMMIEDNRLPSLPKRDEVVRVLRESVGNSDEVQKRVEAIDPRSEIYMVILESLYPELRRNEYKIVYDVRNFNLEEARAMILTRPDLLSLKEMYMVAGSYEKGSEEYERTMRIASESYPDSPAVLNDLAHDLMDKKDYEGIVKMLGESSLTKENPMLLNTLGVAYTNVYDPYKAEEAFSEAAQAGLEEAVRNLEQIRKVIDQL